MEEETVDDDIYLIKSEMVEVVNFKGKTHPVYKESAGRLLEKLLSTTRNFNAACYFVIPFSFSYKPY
tara:strand:- start:162 stop:362 length:201 start_codon:yes stop_codon:yes gene_type:complete